jgi:hypothetical protein
MVDLILHLEDRAVEVLRSIKASVVRSECEGVSGLKRLVELFWR